jgi:hypothetical protein
MCRSTENTMADVFSPLTREQRVDFRAHYLAYLHARDGIPDRENHLFSVRENFFRDVEARPVRWEGTPPVAQADFDAHHARYDADARPSDATLWALAVAKVNRSEKYGVEYAHARGATGGAAGGDPLEYIEIEEFYHTRILRDALDVIGISMEVIPPAPVQRALIKTMVHLPKALSNVLVFDGEIVGVAMFHLLLTKARELFASQPVALARIEELFAQIMVDEVGHVHYARSMLDGPRLAIAKGLLPLIARGVLDSMPEFYALFGRERVMREVMQAGVDAAAAPYADRFVWSPRDDVAQAA